MARTDDTCCFKAGAVKAPRARLNPLRRPDWMDAPYVVVGGALKWTDVNVAGLFAPVTFPGNSLRYMIGFQGRRSAPVTYYFGVDAKPDVFGWTLSGAGTTEWFTLHDDGNLVTNPWFLSCSGTDVLRVYECYLQ